MIVTRGADLSIPVRWATATNRSKPTHSVKPNTFAHFGSLSRSHGFAKNIQAKSAIAGTTEAGGHQNIRGIIRLAIAVDCADLNNVFPGHQMKARLALQVAGDNFAVAGRPNILDGVGGLAVDPGVDLDWKLRLYTVIEG